jgi:hypothetical protein
LAIFSDPVLEGVLGGSEKQDQLPNYSKINRNPTGERLLKLLLVALATSKNFSFFFIRKT